MLLGKKIINALYALLFIFFLLSYQDLNTAEIDNIDEETYVIDETLDETIEEDVRAEQEEAEELARAEKEAADEAERLAKEAADEATRIAEEEKQAAQEEARIAKEEEEAEQKAVEEEARIAKEEAEAERKAAEEEARIAKEEEEAERKAAAEEARIAQEEAEAEKKAAQEEARIAKEEAEAEQKAAAEEARIAKEEAEAEQKAAQEEARIAKEEEEAQRKAAQEEARIAKEEAETEQKAAEEEARREREEAEAEQKELEEEARKEKEEALAEQKAAEEEAAQSANEAASEILKNVNPAILVIPGLADFLKGAIKSQNTKKEVTIFGKKAILSLDKFNGPDDIVLKFELDQEILFSIGSKQISIKRFFLAKEYDVKRLYTKISDTIQASFGIETERFAEFLINQIKLSDLFGDIQNDLLTKISLQDITVRVSNFLTTNQKALTTLSAGVTLASNFGGLPLSDKSVFKLSGSFDPDVESSLVITLDKQASIIPNFLNVNNPKVALRMMPLVRVKEGAKRLSVSFSGDAEFFLPDPFGKVSVMLESGVDANNAFGILRGTLNNSITILDKVVIAKGALISYEKKAESKRSVTIQGSLNLGGFGGLSNIGNDLTFTGLIDPDLGNSLDISVGKTFTIIPNVLNVSDARIKLTMFPVAKVAAGAAKFSAVFNGNTDLSLPEPLGKFSLNLGSEVNAQNQFAAFTGTMKKTINFLDVVKLENPALSLVKTMDGKYSISVSAQTRLANEFDVRATLNVAQDSTIKFSAESANLDQEIKPFVNVPVLPDVAKQLSLSKLKFEIGTDKQILIQGTARVGGLTTTGRFFNKDGVKAVKLALEKMSDMKALIPALAGTPIESLNLSGMSVIVSSGRFVDPDTKGEVNAGISLVSQTDLSASLLTPARSLLGVGPSEKVTLTGGVGPQGTSFGFSVPKPTKLGSMEMNGVVLEMLVKPPSTLELWLKGKMKTKLPQQAQDTEFVLACALSMNPSAPEVKVAGTMLGEWKNPLGIKNITVKDVAIETAIAFLPAPPHPSSLGFAGTMKIADKEIAVATKVAQSGDMLLYGELKGKLSLRDMPSFARYIGAQLPDNLDKIIPDVGLEDAAIYVSPKNTSIGELQFQQGLTIRGKVDIALLLAPLQIAAKALGSSLNGKAMLNISISTAGIVAEASLPNIDLGKVGSMTLLKITGKGLDKKEGTADDGPAFGLTLNTSKQEVFISGTMELLGGKGDCQLDLSPQNFSLHGEMSMALGKIEVNGAFKDGDLGLTGQLERGNFDWIKQAEVQTILREINPVQSMSLAFSGKEFLAGKLPKFTVDLSVLGCDLDPIVLQFDAKKPQDFIASFGQQLITKVAGATAKCAIQLPGKVITALGDNAQIAGKAVNQAGQDIKNLSKDAGKLVGGGVVGDVVAGTGEALGTVVQGVGTGIEYVGKGVSVVGSGINTAANAVVSGVSSVGNEIGSWFDDDDEPSPEELRRRAMASLQDAYNNKNIASLNGLIRDNGYCRDYLTSKDYNAMTMINGMVQMKDISLMQAIFTLPGLRMSMDTLVGNYSDKALIKEALDKKIVDINDGSALIRFYNNPDMQDFLLNYPGMDINKEKGSYIIQLVSASMLGMGYRDKPMKPEYKQLAQKLINNPKLNLDVANYQDTPLIVLSAQGGDKDIVDLIITKNPNLLTKVDSTGNSALHAAIQYESSLATFLINKYPALLKIADKNGKTPLMAATKISNIDMVKLILSKDTSTLNTKDSSGRTALFYATNKDVFELLFTFPNIEVNIQASDNATIINYWIQDLDFCVRIISDKKFSIDINDKDISSKLTNDIRAFVISKKPGAGDAYLVPYFNLWGSILTAFADKMMKANQVSSVLRLLKEKDQPQMTIADKNGNTVLMLAINNGNRQVIDFLLDQPAPQTYVNSIKDMARMDAANVDGLTALHYAVQKEDVETIGGLLFYRGGARTDMKNKDGQTAQALTDRVTDPAKKTQIKKLFDVRAVGGVQGLMTDLSIDQVKYGKGDKNIDVTDIARNKFAPDLEVDEVVKRIVGVPKNKQKIIIPKNILEVVGTDPAPGEQKELRIIFSRGDEAKICIIPEGTAKTITPVTFLLLPDLALEVPLATYGKPNSIREVVTVTSIVKNNFLKDGKVVVPANILDVVKTDPAPGVVKVIRLAVRWGITVRNFEIKEGTALTITRENFRKLPEGPAPIEPLLVEYALYGKDANKLFDATQRKVSNVTAIVRSSFITNSGIVIERGYAASPEQTFLSAIGTDPAYGEQKILVLGVKKGEDSALKVFEFPSVNDVLITPDNFSKLKESTLTPEQLKKNVDAIDAFKKEAEAFMALRNSPFTIELATWGVDTNTTDVTEIVKSKFALKDGNGLTRTINITSNRVDTWNDDPAPGKAKVLRIKVKRADKSKSFECPEFGRLYIAEETYDSLPAGPEPVPPKLLPNGTITLKSARFWNPQYASIGDDITPDFRNLCVKDGTIVVPSDLLRKMGYSDSYKKGSTVYRHNITFVLSQAGGASNKEFVVPAGDAITITPDNFVLGVEGIRAKEAKEQQEKAAREKAEAEAKEKARLEKEALDKAAREATEDFIVDALKKLQVDTDFSNDQYNLQSYLATLASGTSDPDNYFNRLSYTIPPVVKKEEQMIRYDNALKAQNKKLLEERLDVPTEIEKAINKLKIVIDQYKKSLDAGTKCLGMRTDTVGLKDYVAKLPDWIKRRESKLMMLENRLKDPAIAKRIKDDAINAAKNDITRFTALITTYQNKITAYRANPKRYRPSDLTTYQEIIASFNKSIADAQAKLKELGG